VSALSPASVPCDVEELKLKAFIIDDDDVPAKVKGEKRNKLKWK
jgi:hypothetical protein